MKFYLTARQVLALIVMTTLGTFTTAALSSRWEVVEGIIALGLTQLIVIGGILWAIVEFGHDR